MNKWFGLVWFQGQETELNQNEIEPIAKGYNIPWYIQIRVALNTFQAENYTSIPFIECPQTEIP